MGREQLRADRTTHPEGAAHLLCAVNSQGRATSLSAGWESTLGWSHEELTSRPLADFIHPTDRARAFGEISRASAPGGESVEFECRFRARWGKWRWLRWQVSADGEGWFANALDVTAEKESEERLRRALTPERLVAYSQPIIDQRRRAVVQEELLVRLRDPADPNRVLLPAQFLPETERAGLIAVVDRWMVHRAVAMAMAGRRAEVNLSARSIGDHDFMAELEQSVRSAGPAAANLVFEITETAALEHLDVAVEFANRLTGLGCQFALDDFGTGFGSLTQLRWLPVHFVKIDAAFVRHATVSPRDRAVVEGVVDIAHRFGMRTVAEGIEDAATLSLLNACRVDYVQGFFMGGPVPLEHPRREIGVPGVTPIQRRMEAPTQPASRIARWGAAVAVCVAILLAAWSGGGLLRGGSGTIGSGAAPGPTVTPPHLFGPVNGFSPLLGAKRHPGVPGVGRTTRHSTRR